MLRGLVGIRVVIRVGIRFRIRVSVQVRVGQGRTSWRNPWISYESLGLTLGTLGRPYIPRFVPGL